MAPWNREARLYGCTSWDDTSLQEGMRSTQSGWGDDPASAAAEESFTYVELAQVRRLSLLVCTAVYGLAVRLAKLDPYSCGHGGQVNMFIFVNAIYLNQPKL